MISTVRKVFKENFYQYDKCKLYGCYTLKMVNTSIKPFTKVLLINFKDRIIFPVNKQPKRRQTGKCEMSTKIVSAPF